MKNENILYADRDELGKLVDLSKQWTVFDKETLNRLPPLFAARISAENDPTKKQLIPYVLVQNTEGKLLSYRRCGSEKRLAQKLSLGIGGHVNDGDLKESLYDTLVTGACREIKEEIGFEVAPGQLKLHGLINEEISDVGHVHTGIVFTLSVDPNKLSFDTEIGTPEWIAPQDLNEDAAELWSSLALKLL